ncbi:MAG TPA: family 16 glycoside hydrolase [Terracidiphilus sp.]|nr:family 16 glycoside hydrolase [Terracidiphilus sp.]
MRNLPSVTRTLIVVVTLGGVLAAGTIAYIFNEHYRARHNHYENMSGWQPITGRWSSSSGIITNANYGRGDMLVAVHSDGTNYKIAADVRFDLLFADTHRGDAGIVIRTTDPEPGVDSYEGYYAGLRPDDQSVILGRASFDWHELRVAALASPVAVGSWYHLELAANGCTLNVVATPLGGGRATSITYRDTQCLNSGVAGLRSFYTQASWRNVRITRN